MQFLTVKLRLKSSVISQPLALAILVKGTFLTLWEMLLREERRAAILVHAVSIP